MEGLFGQLRDAVEVCGEQQERGERGRRDGVALGQRLRRVPRGVKTVHAVPHLLGRAGHRHDAGRVVGDRPEGVHREDERRAHQHPHCGDGGPVHPAVREAGGLAPPRAEGVREEERDRDGDDRGSGGFEADRGSRDDRGGRAGLRRLRDLPNRARRSRRVVAGDVDEGQARENADDARVEEPVPRVLLVQQRVGDERHEHDREPGGDVEAQVEGVHRVAFLSPPHHEDAGDAGDEPEGADDEREHHPGDVLRGKVDRDAEDHRSDVLRGRRLEEIGASAGAVAHVVADQVRDHGRVPRIVLGDPRLDLADEIGAQIGGFGVDPAAELGEERHERSAEAEADDEEGGLARVAEAVVREEHHEDADERERDDEDPRDRSAAQGDPEGITDRVLSRGARTEVRLHRDEHADDPRQHRRDRADEERDGGPDGELRRCDSLDVLEEVDDGADQHRPAQREQRDRPVLPPDEGDRRDVDQAGDPLHLGRSDRRAQHVPGEIAGDRQGEHAGERDDPDQRGIHGLPPREERSSTGWWHRRASCEQGSLTEEGKN